MARKTVQLDLSPLRRFSRALDNQIDGGSGPIGDFFKQAGARYLSMAEKRFEALSEGGSSSVGQSTWPPIAPATKRSKRRKRKRQGATGGRFAILRDTGTMFRALLRGGPGNVFKRIRGGIEVGIGGNEEHPQPGGLTIGELAAIHDQGLGNVPEREIIPDEMDPQTVSNIHGDMRRAIGKLGRRSQ